jgi:hypothetical protein
MSFAKNRIRLALELTKPLVGSVDFFTGVSPEMPVGRAVQFELGLFNNGALDDLAQLTSVRLEVKELLSAGVIDKSKAPVMVAVVSAVDFTQVTQGQWEAGTGQHVTVAFAAADTGLTVSATTNRTDYGWVVTGSVGGEDVTLGSGTVTAVADGGLTVVESPEPGDPGYVRLDTYVADMAGTIKQLNAAGATITLVNEDGYGVRLSVSAGSAPELVTEVIAPAVGA